MWLVSDLVEHDTGVEDIQYRIDARLHELLLLVPRCPVSRISFNEFEVSCSSIPLEKDRIPCDRYRERVDTEKIGFAFAFLDRNEFTPAETGGRFASA